MFMDGDYDKVEKIHSARFLYVLNIHWEWHIMKITFAVLVELRF